MIQQLNAIIVFSIITFGLGHGVLTLAKATRIKNPLLHTLEMAAVGLATFSFLAVVFNLLYIPLHPLAYLILAAIMPVITITKQLRAKETPLPEWKLEETICAVLLLIILVGFFAVFYKGANAYPYLEDDDPWNHAQSTLYIAKAHTYSIDPTLRATGGYANYLEPYPPTYDVIMGIMRQVNDSVYWTLKFFNVLLITLAIAFSFLFFKAYLKSDQKALFATLCLAVIPSFMSHFIWSQTLALVVFPVAMYAAVKALNDKTWTMPAIISVASMMVTQPVVSFVFGVVLVLLVVFVFAHEAMNAKRWNLASFPQTTQGLIVGAAGLALSFLYWGAQIVKWGVGGIFGLKGGELTSGWGGGYALQSYTLQETLFPSGAGRIDQATGWGIIISLAVIAAVVIYLFTAQKTLLPRRNWMHLHLLVWFALLWYAVFAPSFGLPGWGSSRAWAYLAIPVVLLATEGVFALSTIAGKQQLLKLAIIIIAAIGIALTSAPAKIQQQTSTWPGGAQWTYVQTQQGIMAPDLMGFIKMRELLPANTRVYSFCSTDARSIGFDMDSTPWNPEEAAFRQRLVNVTPQEALAFLDQYNYQYFTVDATCVRDWGQNKTEDFLQTMGRTGRLQITYQQQGFLLAHVQQAPAGPFIGQ